MRIALVIPAFNESRRIGTVLKSVKKFRLPTIVVDDGSKDLTEKIVKKYKVTLIKHKLNLGKGAALKTGCEAAFLKGAEAIIIMDSDGQHKPEDLPKFIKLLNTKKYQVIFGSRNLYLGMPLVRLIGNRLASVLIYLLYKVYVSDLICGYRAFTKKAYKKIRWQSSGYGVETEMVIKVGIHKLKYCELVVDTIYHDTFKGVTVLDALGILFNVLKWRFIK